MTRSGANRHNPPEGTKGITPDRPSVLFRLDMRNDVMHLSDRTYLLSSTPRIALLLALFLGLILISGCGGGDGGTPVTSVPLSNTSPLSVVSGPTISGGSSCTTSLKLRNPDPVAYDFTFIFNGFDAAGSNIATATFESRIDPSATQTFSINWLVPFAPNSSTACTSIQSTGPGPRNTIPVATVAILRAAVPANDQLDRIDDVWSETGEAGMLGNFSVDAAGRLFAQNRTGCVVSGRLWPEMGLTDVYNVTLQTSQCQMTDPIFHGVVLIREETDASGTPLDVFYLWSASGSGQRIDLAAIRS